jgi:hypothetical protein
MISCADVTLLCAGVKTLHDGVDGLITMGGMRTSRDPLVLGA